MKRLFIQALVVAISSLSLTPVWSGDADGSTAPVVHHASHKGRPFHRSLVRFVPSRPSFGEVAGLHITRDELALKSSVAYVIDQDTNEVLLSKNDEAVLPIASITKLMTGVLISEAKLNMD